MSNHVVSEHKCGTIGERIDLRQRCPDLPAGQSEASLRIGPPRSEFVDVQSIVGGGFDVYAEALRNQGWWAHSGVRQIDTPD